MPEAKHYDDDLLDFCYVYTFDEKYKAGLLATMGKAYETRRQFLKQKCKTFSLEKEYRDLDFDGLGEREVLNRIYDALVEKDHLGSDKQRNRMILAGHGFVIGDEFLGQALHGVFVRTDMVAEATSYYGTRKRVDTHKHGMQLPHSTDAIKTAIGLSTGKVKTILERLFRKGGNSKKKLLALNTAEFYAFVINNEHLLRDDFRKITATVWVIETKGGESKGKDKNIDIQIENKFNAFKIYAEKHGLHWGFIRDKDNRLYINNTEFAIDMADDHWKPISQES